MARTVLHSLRHQGALASASASGRAWAVRLRRLWPWPGRSSAQDGSDGTGLLRWCLLQADDRPLSLFRESRPLACDAHDDSPERMRDLNGGSLARKWDYWSVSSLINQLKCPAMRCSYARLRIEPRHHPKRHVTWGKIRIVLDFMRDHPEIEIIAFLDSDAFVRDESRFTALVRTLANTPSKHGIFSRDPLLPKNTFINTGCMILKNDAFTRDFLEQVWADPARNPRYRREWPHEQFSASAFVEAHQDAFFVCRTQVLNTPCGEIVRHSWWKELFDELAFDELLSASAARLHGTSCPPPPDPAFDIRPLLDA